MNFTHHPIIGEFASPAPAGDDVVSRRNFLKLMGASVALASLSGCTREPIHPIVPYVKQPEELVPGRPLHYATAMPFDGFATGLVVESHEGHPTKIEGNPGHPSSLGATGIFEQAALLDLYDPDRARSVTNAGRVSSYAQFLASLEKIPRHGAGLRFLTHSITSPTLIAQMEELLRQFPEARWHQYQPFARDNTFEGARLSFGRDMETRWHLDKARVIVSLDADFLFAHPANIANTRQFSVGRKTGNRLYMVEPTPSLTGSVSDHRLPAAQAEIEQIALALSGQTGNAHKKWIEAVAKDLQANAGSSLVIAGEAQPPWIHALVHSLNGRLGNVGKTVEYADSAEGHWINHRESLTQLTEDMAAGKVESLIILGGNPVFDSPVELAFGSGLERVKYRTHLNTEFNETSVKCDWHVPESHFLESWSDARSFDGTTSIVQPLIAPLYDSKTAHELLHWLTRREVRSDYDIVRDYWNSQKPGENFEKWWRQSLHDGWIGGLAIPASEVRPNPVSSAPSQPANGLELCFRPDPSLWDGRFANNAWLQELPKPFSKVTWDNPALISPALAKRMQLESGDMVRLQAAGRSLAMPVWIMPGQAENAVTIHAGGGRSRTGRVGKNIGFNGYAFSSAASGLALTKIGGRHSLATTQHTHSVEGRDLVRDATDHREPQPASADTLYNPGEFKTAGLSWGMAIDLGACIGCNACVLACQSENNIPVVGKDQVAAGRDMAWIRIDQYFKGPPENPRVYHQPVPCMHCENAPCELVCPVGATVHDHQGLNLQVYNRCVGTRYCSNNCPYKVRRFNFYRYADYETPSLKPMRNPNVTVRWRGVMEKCTYCVQRISVAKIAAELAGREVREGEVKTACQQVCPAQAITFGNINDPGSAVAKAKASPLNYAMLGELNTRPRTTYLARARNPNPALEEPS